MKIWSEKWIATLGVLMLLASTLAIVAGPSSAGASTNTGFWVLDASGRVTSSGGAPEYGDRRGSTGAAAVSIVATPSGKGYYIVDTEGTVTAHGDAIHRGDLTDIALAAPIVAMATSGSGYVLVGRDGGVFAFGTQFRGSAAGLAASPIADILANPDGSGYLVIADDGGVFAFGGATYRGSVPAALPPGTRLDRPVVAASMTSSGGGYVMAGGDGGVFNFGRVGFRGSLAASGKSYVAIVALGNSYALLEANGRILDLVAVGTQNELAALGITNAVDFAAVSVTTASTPTTAKAPTTTETKSQATGVTSGPASTKKPTATTKKPTATTKKPTATTKKPTATTTTQKPTATTKKPAPTTTQSQPTGGSGKQFTVYTMNGVVQDWNQYADANFKWPSSGSMKAPTNYAGGRSYVRFQVVSKPTSIPMVAQLCFWFQYTPGKFDTYEETCSAKSKLQLTDEVLLYADLGAPSSWWSQNGPKNRTGVFDWGKKPHVGRIFLKDDKTGTLFIETKCGSACWSGGNAADHLPVRMNVELIFVEKGKSFSPPSNWNGSPWS